MTSGDIYVSFYLKDSMHLTKMTRIDANFTCAYMYDSKNGEQNQLIFTTGMYIPVSRRRLRVAGNGIWEAKAHLMTGRTGKLFAISECSSFIRPP